MIIWTVVIQGWTPWIIGGLHSDMLLVISGADRNFRSNVLGEGESGMLEMGVYKEITQKRMKGIRSSINLQRGDVHASRTRWGCQRCWACFRCAGAQRAGVSTLSELCWCSKTRPSWETTWSWRGENSCSLRYNVVRGDDECDKCSLRIRIDEPASTFSVQIWKCFARKALRQKCKSGSKLLTGGWLAWLVHFFLFFFADSGLAGMTCTYFLFIFADWLAVSEKVQKAGSKNATLLNKFCEKWNPGTFNWVHFNLPRCDLERKLKWHLCKHQIAPGCVQI